MGKWLALAGVTLGLLALADVVLHRSKDAHNNHSATRDRQAAPLATLTSSVLAGDSASSIDEGNTHRDEYAHEHESERVPANVHGHGHEHAHEDEHGHDHASTPKIAWLLLLPIAVAFAVVPPALGKWGIDRSSNAAIVATRTSNYPPLGPSKVPRLMATNEFVARAFDKSGLSLNGVAVSIEGFVIERRDDYVVIGRYSIACCAADAVAAQIQVQLPNGTSNTPGPSGPQGEWVRATGVFANSNSDDLPKLTATTLAAISPPSNTYEG